MPLITKFEDIEAWQQARLLTRQMYQVAASGNFSRDYGLRDQVQRAAVSSMTNIAEGFDCESKVEFARFLARRSGVEVQSLLYVALDAQYITQAQFELFYEQARKTKALIGGFRGRLIRQSKTWST
jgi:four helix bundle protein